MGTFFQPKVDQTRDVRKTFCPLKHFFVTDVLYDCLGKVGQGVLEFLIGNVLGTFDLWPQYQLGSSATQDECADQVWGRLVKAISSYWSDSVLSHLTTVTLTFDPVTQKSIGFICYQRWIRKPSLRKVGQGVLQVLIVNGFGRFEPGDLWPSDHLLPRMDVWTKFEEGR